MRSASAPTWFWRREKTEERKSLCDNSERSKKVEHTIAPAAERRHVTARHVSAGKQWWNKVESRRDGTRVATQTRKPHEDQSGMDREDERASDPGSDRRVSETHLTLCRCCGPGIEGRSRNFIAGERRATAAAESEQRAAQAGSPRFARETVFLRRAGPVFGARADERDTAAVRDWRQRRLQRRSTAYSRFYAVPGEDDTATRAGARSSDGAALPCFHHS